MVNYWMTKTIQTSGRTCYEERARIDIGFIILERSMIMDGIVKKSADGAAAGKAKRRLETLREGLYHLQSEHLNLEGQLGNSEALVDLLNGNSSKAFE